MAIQPCGERILVKLMDQEEKSPGGIIVPDTAKEKPQQGKVMAVGKGRLMENGTVRALEVKVGDTILFGKYVGSDVLHEDKEFLILGDEDVLAVLEENKK